jgi:hypothetical protein
VRIAINGITGAIVAVLLSGHTVSVVAQRLASRRPDWQPGEPHATLFGVPWDFRFFALILFGVLGVACGVRCIDSAAGMASSRTGAVQQGVRASLAMLILFAPVIPLQHFALLTTALATLNLAALATLRSACSPEPD